MIRLSNSFHDESAEIYKLTSLCLTETIKNNLKVYFEKDYNSCSNDDLYTYVDIDTLIEIIPLQIIHDIESVGLDANIFIAKKLAQIMAILNSDEYIVLDIFNEYLLYLIVRDYQSDGGIDIVASSILDVIPKVESLFLEYAKDSLDFETKKECNTFVKESVATLVCFSAIFGTDDSDGYLIWDYDFMFIESRGLLPILNAFCSKAVGGSLGYDQEYVSDVFSSVGESIQFTHPNSNG